MKIILKLSLVKHSQKSSGIFLEFSRKLEFLEEEDEDEDEEEFSSGT